MNIAHSESAKILTIVPLGYRARCTEDGYSNVGRVILPATVHNAEFCSAYARVTIDRDSAAGRRIYDERS